MLLYERFCVWVGHLKLSRVIISVSVILFLVPLVTHYYLSKYDTTPITYDKPMRHTLEALGDLSTMTAADLKVRIDEMLRIKASVSTELRELEARRARLQREAASATAAAEDARAQHSRALVELQRVRASAEQARLAQIEATRRDSPKLAPPDRLLPNAPPPFLTPPTAGEESNCRMHNCFDYSRCSLSSGFPIFFYDPDEYSPLIDAEIDGFLKTSLRQTLGYNPHITNDPNIACMYIILVGEAFPVEKNPLPTEEYTLRLNVSALQRLPYWGGDGRNHILINVARRELSAGGVRGAGRAMVAQAAFSREAFRSGFDVVIPPALGPPAGDVWKDCAPMVPARRKYLISFQGSQAPLEGASGGAGGVAGYRGLEGWAEGGGDSARLQWACEPVVQVRAPPGDWALCGTERSRRDLLQQSTFALILAPAHQTLASTPLLQARLYEALRSGAIPVILGGDRVELPFAEFVDWRRAVMSIPEPRAPELHFLLRSFPDADILSLRRQGRVLWERYASSLAAMTAALVATLRNRVGLPAAAAEPAAATPGFAGGFGPPALAPPPLESAPDEALGPLEPPYASPAFTRNYSYSFLHGYEMWNNWLDPFTLYPQIPWEPAVTSDARFVGSPGGFRIIGGGAGGAGKEFTEALGGDRPKEQFTIVILTYEREAVLAAALARLRGLPYLNKVVVIWNGMSSPEMMTTWPESGAPIAVVKASKNSLNNRFMPYDVIETEAVLCVDDDAHLRHDEIIFAFRVWRENRDRIVGFPGRYHAWDLNFNNGFLYNSNYSCELSMVLTGAAFIHRYYLWAYWSLLPAAIRDYVDEYMNCEDIAMNFLVAHITRKPPVKVTSRWTFRCPGCPMTLSADETHFQERHKCIQFFGEVMGYTPLMVTQFRADSVLFKTRIPHDKQKCFKFI